MSDELKCAFEEPTQPSGGGFIAVDLILKDLTDRKGLRQSWEAIDDDTQADIKHAWALAVTEVLDMQAVFLKHQTTTASTDANLAQAIHDRDHAERQLAKVAAENMRLRDAEAEWRALCEKLVEALTQILDDGEHISDYVAADETPVFNHNGKQGFYCYAAAEQAMEALAEAKLKGVANA